MTPETYSIAQKAEKINALLSNRDAEHQEGNFIRLYIITLHVSILMFSKHITFKKKRSSNCCTFTFPQMLTLNNPDKMAKTTFLFTEKAGRHCGQQRNRYAHASTKVCSLVIGW